MCLTRWCLALALLGGFTHVSAQEQSLKIMPTKALVRPTETLTVTCAPPNTQQEQCEFRVRYHDNRQPRTTDSPVLAANSGGRLAKTQVNDPGTGTKLCNVESAETLAKGGCGIRLSDLREGRYLVGCRAGSHQGGWDERYMALYVDGKEDGFIRVNTTYDTMKLMAFNKEATVDLKLNPPDFFVGPCSLEGQQEVKLRKDRSPSLDAGNTTCSLPIEADDQARGVMWASAPTQSGGDPSKTWNFHKIIVVEKPKSATLALSLPLAVGDETTATCKVHESRFGADFTWTFGEETLAPLAAGWTVTTKNNTDAWSWPWETKTIEQTVAKRLGPEDQGKPLKCTATFFDAKGNVEGTMEMTNQVTLKTTRRIALPWSTLGALTLHLALSVSLCFNVALAVLAALIYAILTEKCCFKRKAGNVEPQRLDAENRYLMPRTLEVPAYQNVNCEWPAPEPVYLEVLPEHVNAYNLWRQNRRTLAGLMRRY